MEIYTIGFAGKSAPQFFGLLKTAGVKLLVDIRLNNSSQLAGYTKADSLPFFLKEICNIDYHYELLLAPTSELLTNVRSKAITWEEYERQYLALLAERRVEEKLDKSLFSRRVVLLCSEAKPEQCHRKLAAEYLKEKWGGVEVVHL